MVSSTYSNDKNPGGEVQAYAKIAGRNWTYFVKTLETTIGRNTEGDRTGEKPIDIDLGPAKVVSRQHATILYNLQTRVWELRVAGRNGVKIDTVRVPTGSDVPRIVLRCGTVMDIGGTQMMFILPDTPPEISPAVLNMVQDRLPGIREYISKRANYNQQYYNNNRLTFSNSYQNGPMYGQQAPTAAESYGAALDKQQGYTDVETDLLKEEAKDTKPPYLYATMITQAILLNEEGVLSLADIYEWISSHYAYYRYLKTGWQNLIRHNLSLNKAFEKVPRRPNEPGKGMKWQISESYKQEFLNNLASGAISKAKRGSSVSRQLQMHLEKHHKLPSGFTSNKPAQTSLQPNEAPRPTPTTLYPQTQQYSMPGAQYGDNGLLYMAAAAADMNSVQAPVLSERGATAKNDETPSPKIGSTSTNSNKENNYEKDIAPNAHANIDIMSFLSPNKAYAVSALEAYTPERGSSKNVTKDKEESKDSKSPSQSGQSEGQLINGHTNLQASPAIWNFVQFGTPLAPTPKTTKKEEEENMKHYMEGSPIQQRRRT